MINEKIQEYAEKFTSDESGLLRELREKTFAIRGDRQMLSGFYQGRLLAMLSKIISPHRVLEIGTFTGYSALCLAEGLPPDGKILSLDTVEETHRLAKSYWERSDYKEQIDGAIGDASDVIPRLNTIFDIVFIDADKANYSNYFDLVFPKVRVGGLIIADNVLWDGKVLNEDKDISTQALHDYNQKITTDERVSNILLTVRDGLMISRKEKD